MRWHGVARPVVLAALLLGLLVALAAPRPAAAHGGIVWVDDNYGAFHIVVQTIPTTNQHEWRFTVLVNEFDNGDPIADAQVRVRAALTGTADSLVEVTAPPEAGQPGFYDVPIRTPQDGTWAVSVHVQRNGKEGTATFDMPVQTATDYGAAVWVLAALPILLALGIFVYYWRQPPKAAVPPLDPAAAVEPEEHDDWDDDQGGNESPEHNRVVIGNEAGEVHAAEADDKRDR
jgi:hypothetical protein